MNKYRFREKVQVCSRCTFAFKYSEGTRARAEGEGSTCPSRGELWLTVYRAHASSVARERVDSRFWKCAPFSEKLRWLDDFHTFCTLPILIDQERCK